MPRESLFKVYSSVVFSMSMSQDCTTTTINSRSFSTFPKKSHPCEQCFSMLSQHLPSINLSPWIYVQTYVCNTRHFHPAIHVLICTDTTFLRLKNIPWYEMTALKKKSILLFFELFLTSGYCEFRLIRTFVYKLLCGSIFPVLSGTYPGVELLLQAMSNWRTGKLVFQRKR